MPINKSIVPKHTRFPLNAKGEIQNICRHDNLLHPWTSVIADIVACYQRHVTGLKSVYVRGSVALGTAIPSLSDIDTFAVVDGVPPFDTTWMDRVASSICKEHPYVAAVELHQVPEAEILSNRRAALFIKTQSLCVFGHDYSDEISPFVLGVDSFSHALTFKSELEMVTGWIKECTCTKDIQSLSRSLAKRFLRAAFEICMDVEQYYTRELYVCATAAKRRWADQEPCFDEALQVGIYGSPDKDHVLDLMRRWAWLGEYVSVHYETVNVTPCFIDGYSYLNLKEVENA